MRRGVFVITIVESLGLTQPAPEAYTFAIGRITATDQESRKCYFEEAGHGRYRFAHHDRRDARVRA